MEVLSFKTRSPSDLSDNRGDVILRRKTAKSYDNTSFINDESEVRGIPANNIEKPATDLELPESFPAR